MGVWDQEYDADIYKKLSEDAGAEEPTDEQLLAQDNYFRCKECGKNVLRITDNGNCLSCDM